MLLDQPTEALAALEPAREKWRGDSALASMPLPPALAIAVQHYRKDMSSAERQDSLPSSRLARRASPVGPPSSAPPEAFINMGLYFYLRQEF